MCETMVVNVLCSIAASFIFLFLVLLFFKPKLRISPFICKGPFVNGEEFYFIKLINISVFSAYDVRVELLEVDRYPTANGQMHDRLQPLPLVLSRISCIPGYRPSRIRKNAPYAIRLRTKADIDGILKDEYKSIMVRVTLKHGLTGLVKVIRNEYFEKQQIKYGKFRYGLRF